MDVLSFLVAKVDFKFEHVFSLYTEALAKPDQGWAFLGIPLQMMRTVRDLKDAIRLPQAYIVSD